MAVTATRAVATAAMVGSRCSLMPSQMRRGRVKIARLAMNSTSTSSSQEWMKAKIEPRHWIAPRANPEFSHDFPIELGATRLYGEVKPWAPSFSYGLLIETDAVLMPTGSAQSRANGQRHAISDIAVWNGDLITVSRASGEILNLGAMP